MPTATKIDRATLRLISAEAEKALQAVAEKFGVTITPGRSVYSNGDTGALKFDMVIRKETTDGRVLDIRAVDFQRYAAEFGFEASDLDREFKSNGKTYRIVGLKPNSPRFPVLAQDVSTNKTYKFPAETVLFQLGKHRLQQPAPAST